MDEVLPPSPATDGRCMQSLIAMQSVAYVTEWHRSAVEDAFAEWHATHTEDMFRA